MTESLEARTKNAYQRPYMQQLSGDSPPPPSHSPSFPGAARGTRKRVLFGKVWVDSVTFDEAIAEIERLVDGGEGARSLLPTSIMSCRSTQILRSERRTTKRA